MTQLLKKFGLIFVLAFATFFSSCEKDLYEEAIVNDYNKIENKYVSIDKVPQLIPLIKKYNTTYDYLINGTEVPPKRRGVDDLDLNLQQIIEATGINNEKTYSVAINNYIETNEKLYYENLHIIEKNGIYQTIILKYLPNDDSKEVDFTNYTGDIELYDINKAYLGIIQFENSLSRCVKITVGCYVLCFFPNGEVWLDDSGCTGSSGDSGPSDGNNNNNSGTNNEEPGNSGTTFGGLDTGATTSGTNGGGTDLNTTNPPYSTSGSVIVPNTAWPADASNFNKSKLIRNKLELTPNEFTWLQNNPSITSEIYTYLGNNLFSDEEDAVMEFTNEVIDQMIENPSVFSSINPFLIEKQINDTNLDPCSKGILNQFKNLQQNDIAKILAKLGNPSSAYNLNVLNGVPSHPLAAAITNWAANGNNIIPYNYNITIRNSYINQATKLSIASTLLHELVHAYFLSLIDDCYQQNNCALLQTFPELWNYYVSHEMNGDLTDPDSQHNQIALSYVNILADALEEFQPGLPKQYYKDLIWDGLSETTPYNNNNPLTQILTQEDKTRIEKISEAEKTNTPQYNIFGTMLQYYPQGVPCQ